MKKLVLLFTLIIGLVQITNAQSSGCGTIEPTTDPMPAKMHPAYQMFMNNFNPTAKSMLLDTIPYKIHVVRNTSGTGGISTSDLNAAFNIVNGFYSNANLYFKQCGAINYIDNDTYYDFFTSDEGVITGANNVSDVINIYFFNSITTTAGQGLCGYAYFPGGADVITMANSCATNGSTLSHEIGHYFNLYHTHTTSTGTELVNGSNCSTTGDLLCDTPADPQLGTATVNTSCIYTGTATDPLGATYVPDPTNIMSYSRKTCRTYFSPQQYARISFAATNLRSYLTCSSGGGGGTGLINGCAATSQYPAATFTPTTSWQTAATNIYAGEYSVYNVVAGATYEWSLCTTDGGSVSYDSELTLTDASNNELAYNNDFCATQSKIAWTSTITGTVRVHITENHCQTNSTNTTLVYQEQVNPGSPNLDRLSDNIAIAGNNVTLDATIENNGTAAAGAFSVRFYASTNNIISTGDIEIYTTSISSLAANATTTINQPINLCGLPALNNGAIYYFGYIIDYANTVTESNETDNIWAWTTSFMTLNCVNGCVSASQYPNSTFTPTTSWQTAATNIYAGEYSVYNVVAGTTYEWSLCTADGGNVTYDSELTLTDVNNNSLDYNNDFCGTASKISWIATISGTVRVHITENSCQSNSTNTTLVYKQQPTGCISTSQYPNSTFTPTTSWQTAATNIYAGEYSVYNVVAGITYEWSLCTTDGGNVTYDSEMTLTDDNDNILAYNNDFCGTGSKISWSSTVTGTIRIHISENSCQPNITNTTLVYKEQGSAGSPNLDRLSDNITITGNNVTLDATVENNGSVAAGAFSVRFYASTNTIISTGDTEIYTASISSLAANTTMVINQTIDLCGLTALTNNSTYYIGYIIDYSNTVVESDETDNTWGWTSNPVTLNCFAGCLSTSQFPTTTLTPTTSWQTAATNIYAGEYSVYNVVSGTTYEWSLCTTDGGNVTYNSEMTLTDANDNLLDSNDDFCGTASKIVWTSTLTGTVRVHISESACQANSTNTTLVYKQQGSSTLPNLTAINTTSISMNTNTATISFEMENNGGIAAGAFDVRFYASTNTTISTSDVEVAVETYTGLAANTSVSRTVVVDLCNIAGFSPSGNYYIGFLIDEPSQVTESNEGDNTNYFTNAVPLNCAVTTNYTVTTSENPTAGGTTTGGGTFTNGQTATVVATTNTGWNFDGWSENGTTVSNNPTYTFNVTANRNLVAEFSIQIIDITTSSNPAIGGTTSGGGNVPYNQSVTVISTTNAGWLFDRWTENGNTVSTVEIYTFNAVAHRNLVAEFIPLIIDITTVSNPGIGGTTSGGGNVPYNQSVTLTANANAGWNFVNWTENGMVVSSNAAYTFTAIVSRNLVAEFTQQQFTITTNTNPMTGGSATGGGTYNFNQDVTLIATPNAGWNFTGWSENGNIVSTNMTYVFSANGNRNIVAEFTQQQFTITTNTNPMTGGSATGGGTYNFNQDATLTAIPTVGWNFDGWSENGNTVSTNLVYVFSVNADRTLVAEFTQQQFTITVDADSLQGGSVSGGGTFSYNQQATVTATPNPSWLFEGWYENNVLVSNSPTYNFTVVNNRDLMANFDFDVNTNSIVQDVNLTIYPNPATDLININIDHQSLQFNEIHVYNLQGQLVKTANLNAKNNTIVDLDELSAGTYLIQIFTLDNTQYIIQKVIKTN